MDAVIAQNISFYGYWLTSPLGFFGHVCSLITFGSRNLRHTSTGLLFICLTICDLFYLSISIRDFLVFVVKIPTIQNEHLCRARTFIISFSSMTASWTLVLIAVDRWIRVRFPFQQARLCTPKVVVYSIFLVSTCSTLFACHVLQPTFAFMASGSELCGPSRFPPTFYSIFYYQTWPILQLTITYIIPSYFMIICWISLYRKVRLQQILVVASIRRERMQRQMLKLMISSCISFTISTVPFAIYRIVYLRSAINSINPIVTSTVSLLMNINYCADFYIHCLSSQLFRETFVQQLKRVYIWFRRRTGRERMVIHPIAANIR